MDCTVVQGAWFLMAASTAFTFGPPNLIMARNVPYDVPRRREGRWVGETRDRYERHDHGAYEESTEI